MTEERPHEHKPDDRSAVVPWMLLLAGPVVWAVHFLSVYLAAEASCAAQEEAAIGFIGPDTLVVGIVGATVVAAGVCLAAAWTAWRRADSGGDGEVAVEGAMAWAGALTGVGSAVAVLAVGLPALVIGPC